MTWLLRLYPCAWRRRYGAEMREIVSSQPKSLQLSVDLLGGAVDARLNPQAFSQRLERQPADPDGGMDMVNRLKGCDPFASMTPKDGLFTAGLTLGAALAVAAMMVIGNSQLTETIGLTMFPGILVLPVQAVYLRGHSLLAKFALIAGPFAVLFLIGLVAGLAVAD